MSISNGLVSIRKVAEHLNISVATVRKWVRNNTIPENTYIKVNNTYRFDLEEVMFALRHSPPPIQPAADGEITEQLELNFDDEADV